MLVRESEGINVYEPEIGEELNLMTDVSDETDDEGILRTICRECESEKTVKKDCRKCAFYARECDWVACTDYLRKDGKNVWFENQKKEADECGDADGRDQDQQQPAQRAD